MTDTTTHPKGEALDRAESALGTFAEDLGRLLGTAQAKAVSWLEQRKAITDELTRIRDAANHYLQQLTETATGAGRPAARRGRPAGTRKTKAAPASTRKAKPSPRKGRTLTEETKAKMRAAQQARWARTRKQDAGSS